MLDRWKISVNDEERDKSEPVYKVTQNVPYNIINNYFSIGVVSALQTRYKTHLFTFIVMVISSLMFSCMFYSTIEA